MTRLPTRLCTVILLTPAFACLLPALAIGPADAPPPGTTAPAPPAIMPNSMFYMTLGPLGSTSILDVTDLNAELQENGYSSFADDPVFLGFGYQDVHNRTVLDFQAWLSQQQGQGIVDDELYDTQLSSAYVGVNVGYAIVNENRVRVYPMIGAGESSVTLDIARDASGSFGDILSDPGRSGALTHSSASGHVGVGVDFLLSGRKAGGSHGGTILGIRCGRVFSPTDTNWSLDSGLGSSEVPGGPETAVKGNYVSLILSWGNMNR